jgi:hypothetical protein
VNDKPLDEHKTGGRSNTENIALLCKTFLVAELDPSFQAIFADWFSDGADRAALSVPVLHDEAVYGNTLHSITGSWFGLLTHGNEAFWTNS